MAEHLEEVTAGRDSIEAVESEWDAPTRSVSRRFGVMGWFSVTWLTLVALMVAVPGIFPVQAIDVRSRDAVINQDLGPQAGHWLGFDSSGYDLMSKVVYGARASMIVTFVGIVIALLIGGAFGLIAGYFGGRTDTALHGGFNVLLAYPTLILAMAFVTVFASGAEVSYGRRISVVTFALALVSIAPVAMVTRAATMTWVHREFINAARLVGMRTHQIILREVLPNVFPAILSIVLVGAGILILAEGALSLVGVGIPPGIDTPSWGNVVATSRSQIFTGQPWGVIAPSIAIFLTIISLNYLGELIRARLEYRDSVL